MACRAPVRAQPLLEGAALSPPTGRAALPRGPAARPGARTPAAVIARAAPFVAAAPRGVLLGAETTLQR